MNFTKPLKFAVDVPGVPSLSKFSPKTIEAFAGADMASNADAVTAKVDRNFMTLSLKSQFNRRDSTFIC
jgi:hypothetical protein